MNTENRKRSSIEQCYNPRSTPMTTSLPQPHQNPTTLTSHLLHLVTQFAPARPSQFNPPCSSLTMKASHRQNSHSKQPPPPDRPLYRSQKPRHKDAKRQRAGQASATPDKVLLHALSASRKDPDNQELSGRYTQIPPREMEEGQKRRGSRRQRKRMQASKRHGV